MDDKVVRLVTIPEMIDDAHDQSIVDMLNDMLLRAQAGEFLKMAIVATTKDDGMVKAWTEIEDVSSFIGMLEALKFSVLRNNAIGD